MQAAKTAHRIRELAGIVLSDKMDKTCIVEVESMSFHRVFKKRVRASTRYKAHDPGNEAKAGDRVKIREIRPVSRDKRWRLIEVLEKAGEK